MPFPGFKQALRAMESSDCLGIPVADSRSVDTSGFLAAAGINSFFTGQNAANIGVNSQLLDG